MNEVWAIGIVIAATRDATQFVYVWGGLGALLVVSLAALKYRHKWLDIVLLLLAAALLFAFRDVNHLLGDSRLWISEVARTNWSAPSLHSPGYGFLVGIVAELFGGQAAGVMFLSLVSVLCGLGVVLILGASLGVDSAGIPIALIALICQPLGFIFFGHVEPYAVAALFTAIVLVRARRDVADGGLSPALWGLVAIASFVHYSALLVVPAFLSWHLSKRSGRSLALIYAVTMILLFVCFLFFPVLKALTPFGNGLDGSSWADYLVDILNIWALSLLPGFVLFFRVRREALANGFGSVLSLIVITYALLPVLVYFELGGLRDLDLMANLGVAWSLLLASGYIRSERPHRGGLAISGALGTLALAGIVVINTGTGSAVEVLKVQLSREAMSPSAKAYGYEILAGYEEDRANLAAAKGNLHSAIETIPGNLRVYGALGEIELKMGDTTGAIKSLQMAMKSARAVRTAPLLGELLVRTNQMEDALDVLLSMGDALYDDSRASAALCVAYYRLGMPDSSLVIARRRLSRNSMDPVAHMNVAAALTRLGETEEALNHLRTAVAIDPENKSYQMRLRDLSGPDRK